MTENKVNPGAGLVQRFQLFVVDRPWACLLLAFVAIIVTTAGLSQAKYDNDPMNMFRDDNPGLLLFRDIQDTFTRDDQVIFVIHPENEDIFTRDNLSLLEELTSDSWGLPKTLRVDSLTNFQHTEALEDELRVSDLVGEPDALDAAALDDIRHIALNEPYLVHNLVSAEGHVASVLVSVTSNEKGARDAPEIIRAAEKLEQKFEAKYPGVDIMIAGNIAFRDASQQTTQSEMKRNSIFSSIVILVCLYLMLRSVLSVALTMVVVTLSNVMAMGVIAWSGVEFSPVMGGAPAIILTLAVADSIHLLLSYQHQVRDGLPKREAMLESLRINMQPVFLTSITTAVGFLFLNSAKSPPFADMGNLVSVGVMMAWGLSIAVLPSLVMVLPQQKYQQHDRDHQVMDAFARFIIERRVPVFFASLFVFGFLAICSLKNEFNDVWMEYFDETYEVRRATEFMVDELTGNHRLQFAFPSGESSGVMEPEYMQALDSFVSWARRQENVIFVSSYSDTIKRLNRDMNGGRQEYYRIPDSRALISQYTLMYQLSLPQGLGLENQIDIDRSSIRVNVLLGGVSSNEIIAFEDRAGQWIRENLPERMHTRGAGFDLLLGELSYDNVQGMLVGTALALVVVSLLLVISLKSVKYGLLSLLPNLFPAIVSFGIWGLINGKIGLSVSMVACMTLGIVIDNTVHFLSKYIRARDENNFTTVEATRYAFRTVGLALVATTFVLAMNFGVLATSHYYPNASMGMITSITVVIALLINFLFFVPVLIFIDRHREKKLALQAVPANDNGIPGDVLDIEKRSQ